MNVVMVPSVVGRHRPHLAHGDAGPGAEAGSIRRSHVEYVLDAERLRPFNIDATMRMGYRPRLLPRAHARRAAARSCAPASATPT